MGDTTQFPATTPGQPMAIRGVIGLFEWIPYWLTGLTACIGLAKAFWSSAQMDLANRQTTLYLFTNAYKVPV